ncbi:MATE family efflux transporter [Halolamina litorea]|uniref:Multidrug-efflux transporter n=1 Tax=Halolamina litorea TaxID=1515593 RepID=A0ABD6BPT3_9EURY|nr:MATE family efflux transporter [Halolamina litorea]
MTSTRSERSSLTRGPLLRPLIRLAWPLVAIQLLQVAYNLVDTVWLGRLSADAVGALSLAFPLVFLVISIGGGFTAAGAILVAQHTGAGGDRAAGRIAGQTLGFVGIVSVVVGAVGFLATGPLLSMLPADPATTERVIPLSAEYMRVFFLGSPALFGFFVFSSLMRGVGDTRTPLVVMFVSVLVNVALDPFLIFGWWVFPAMGVEGAAIATVTSRVVATVAGMYVLFGTDLGLTIEPRDLIPKPGPVREIVELGVPTALEQSGTALAMVVATAMVATFPPAVVAAYGLGNRLMSLVTLPAMGLSQAMDTAVGQNLGADEPERATKAVKLGMGLVVAVLAVVAVVVATFPEPIVTAFLPEQSATAAATIGHASTYLRIMSIAFVFFGTFQVAMGTFRGAGNTTTALALSLIALWVVRLPATYLLAFPLGWGPTGVWTAVALGDVVGSLSALFWLSRGTWKSAVVEVEPKETTSDVVPAHD